MNCFKSLEKSISLGEIEVVENKLDSSFPEDYKESLTSVNVGIPGKKYVSILIDEVNEEVIFGVMLGVYENQNFSLIDWTDEYQGELPSDSIIFGTEYGGIQT